MPLKRRWKAVTRKLRELGSIGSALAGHRAPVHGAHCAHAAVQSGLHLLQ